MKILVTGGGGFLGQAICRQLVARGHVVRSMNRQHYPALDAIGVVQRSADIASLDLVIEAAAGVDAIIHSAGRVGAWGRVEDYYETNVRGTDNVLAACELNGIDKLVLTSSPSVVHDGADLEGVDESVPYATHFSSAYAQTKALAEQRVLAANSAQLATVALRPHFVWGPGDPNLLPRILGRARRGQLRLIGDVAKKVDTVYVDNAAEAHVLAVKNSKSARRSPARSTSSVRASRSRTRRWSALAQGRRISAGDAAHAAGPTRFLARRWNRPTACSHLQRATADAIPGRAIVDLALVQHRRRAARSGVRAAHQHGRRPRAVVATSGARADAAAQLTSTDAARAGL
jgi:nucleoside-diphosphate-sugar epimerase